jgi:hypothetical protein
MDPFSNPANLLEFDIDWNTLHSLYEQAINSLLSDSGGCVESIRLVFEGTSFVECDQCDNKIFNPGGGSPFPKKCPVCNGSRRIPVQETEDVRVAIIRSADDFRVFPESLDQKIKYTQGYIETLSRIELYPKLRGCDHIITNIDENGDCNQTVYKRATGHEFCGLGIPKYVLVGWNLEND